MAHSLSEECTSLKHKYDTCFNAWFEGYLEPIVSASSEQRAEQIAAKVEEYDQKCGKLWESYKHCVQRAVKDKGLEDLLDQARKDNALVNPPPPPNEKGSS